MVTGRKCAICGCESTKVFDGLVEWCRHCGACRIEALETIITTGDDSGPR